MRKTKLISFKEDYLSLTLFFLLPLIYINWAMFSDVHVIGGEYTDLRTEFYYTRFYGFSALSEFFIPLWNPYIFGGMPFVATLHPAMFYPLNLIFAILPITYTVNWSIALHLFLSGTFTYYLLKYYGAGRFGSTTAAIVYTFSAPQVMHIYAGHLNVLTAMVWTPLMFMCLDRLLRGDGLRYGIFLSFFIALQLLAGQPQYLFYSMIALSLYLLFLLVQMYFEGSRHGEIVLKLFLFAAVAIFGLALSAVQIMPTAEMTGYSTREDLSYEFVSIFSFPPENLVTYLIPDFFGDMLRTPYWGKNYLWEMTAYLGILPLILAVISLFFVRSRIVWFFVMLACVSIVLALGKYTPLLKLLYSYVPGFNLFRGNSKWIFLNAFSIAVLSGFGADFVIKATHSARKRLRIVIAGLCLLSVTGLLALYSLFDYAWFRKAIGNVVSSGDLFNNPESFMQPGFEVLAASSFKGGIVWAVAFLISAVVLFFLYSYGKLKDKVFQTILVVILVFDLFSFGMRYMGTFDSRETRWDKDVVGFLRQDMEPFRVVAPAMDVNSGMAAGMETLCGYDTIMPKRYSEYINFSQGKSPDEPDLWVDINSINKLTDLLNARYLVLESGQTIANPGMKPIFDNGRYHVYRNMTAMPRAFIVHEARIINGRDDIFRELVSPGFNPYATAILEEMPDIILNGQSRQGTLPKFIEHSPNKVVIDANLTAPGLLVLGDVYYPGWKAYVDGEETKIYSANYVMRAVTLNAGRHRVEFLYEPLSFKVGWMMSLFSLVFAAVFLFWDRRKIEKT